jgi:hypothetical protein
MTGDIILQNAFITLLLFTFYPYFKAFTFGQAQIWNNTLMLFSLLTYDRGKEELSGVAMGFCTLIKPSYGLTLLWSLLAKRKRFAMAFLIGVLCGLAGLVRPQRLAESPGLNPGAELYRQPWRGLLSQPVDQRLSQPHSPERQQPALIGRQVSTGERLGPLGDLRVFPAHSGARPGLLLEKSKAAESPALPDHAVEH